MRPDSIDPIGTAREAEEYAWIRSSQEPAQRSGRPKTMPPLTRKRVIHQPMGSWTVRAGAVPDVMAQSQSPRRPLREPGQQRSSLGRRASRTGTPEAPRDPRHRIAPTHPVGLHPHRTRRLDHQLLAHPQEARREVVPAHDVAVAHREDVGAIDCRVLPAGRP